MSSDRRADDSRLIRIETILETHLVKLVDGLDTLKELQIEAKENKEFRNNFENKVNNIIGQRLNTIEFDKAIKTTIDAEVKKIFDERDVREDFETKVRLIAKEEDNKHISNFNKKLLGVIGTILFTLLMVYLEDIVK